jgi:hypothetical protein
MAQGVYLKIDFSRFRYEPLSLECLPLNHLLPVHVLLMPLTSLLEVLLLEHCQLSRLYDLLTELVLQVLGSMLFIFISRGVHRIYVI